MDCSFETVQATVVVLHRLEEQLGDLVGKIAHADEHTQNILGSSTSLWLSDSSKAPDKEKSGEEGVT